VAEYSLRSLSAEFFDAHVESAYRQWSTADTVRQARVALGIAAIGFPLFGINDLRLLGVSPEAAAWIGLRCAFSAWALWLLLRLRRPMPLQTLDRHLLAFALALDAQVVFSGASRPPDFAPMLMTNQTVLFAVILFWPLRFAPRVANAACFALAMVIVWRATGTITQALVGPLSVSVIFALVAGLPLVRYLERLRRQEFARVQSERVQMEELRAAKEAAEAADRAKTRFLAIVSHEVRTPMNGVLGVLQLMEGSRLDALQRRQVAIARDCAESLTGLLDTIIDYARLGTASETLVPVDFDPRQLLHGVVELLRPRADAQRTAMQVRVDERVPARLRADACKLRQVLVNLLNNAVKFTEHGRIHVALSLRTGEEGTSQSIELVVEDNGIGIPAGKLERIFEEFTQADDSIARRFGGAGLGLAVCRRLVQLLGGTISVTSTSGDGSRFRVAIPVAAASPAGAAAPSAPSVSRRLKVLVVDDDPINQIVACGLLAQLGHDATPAASGAAGVAEIEQASFDAVLMDLHMPTTDGFEAARRIRALADPGRAAVPIMALSADVLLTQDARFTECGLSRLLPKPLRRDALRSALATIDAGAAPAPTRPEKTWSTDASIDLVHLSEQVEALGAPAVGKLLRMFRRVGRQLLGELEAAVLNDKPHRAADLVHRLGSSASALGMARLCRVADRVERAARDGAPSQELIAQTTTLAIEFHHAFDALHDLAHDTRSARQRSGAAAHLRIEPISDADDRADRALPVTGGL
jgi:signal transduction histidine kinase/CheY-like chemotaxis protein/HPt (histidine-containing phosphotransfer) domain-containing protein